MTEIAEIYGIPIDKDPCLLRCSGDQKTSGTNSDEGRIVIIGASHTGRMVGGLAECNQQTIYLTKPGWIVTDENILDLNPLVPSRQIYAACN
jgi:hypothetical protein